MKGGNFMKGKELKTKRKLIGLTQEELALRVGVTKQTISNAESGDVSIVVEKVIDIEIAKAFIEWPIYKDES
jgi:transcriptional regulator with XRE-family HTH domain